MFVTADCPLRNVRGCRSIAMPLASIARACRPETRTTARPSLWSVTAATPRRASVAAATSRREWETKSHWPGADQTRPFSPTMLVFPASGRSQPSCSAKICRSWASWPSATMIVASPISSRSESRIPASPCKRPCRPTRATSAQALRGCHALVITASDTQLLLFRVHEGGRADLDFDVPAAHGIIGTHPLTVALRPASDQADAHPVAETG